jgi:hypothetical protein
LQKCKKFLALGNDAVKKNEIKQSLSPAGFSECNTVAE